jgi:predicted NACHT family NTPase
MLIQGGPGSGKTLFGRFLERYLWVHYYAGSFVPIFLSLPKASDPYSSLIAEALQELGFSDIDPEHLVMERFVFILDGLDELPLETMPDEGILATNEILEFQNAKVLITCRNHYLTALEQKFSITAHQHLTQQRFLVEDVFMMPFDNSQVCFSFLFLCALLHAFFFKNYYYYYNYM